MHPRLTVASVLLFVALPVTAQAGALEDFVVITESLATSINDANGNCDTVANAVNQWRTDHFETLVTLEKSIEDDVAQMPEDQLLDLETRLQTAYATFAGVVDTCGDHAATLDAFGAMHQQAADVGLVEAADEGYGPVCQETLAALDAFCARHAGKSGVDDLCLSWRAAFEIPTGVEPGIYFDSLEGACEQMLPSIEQLETSYAAMP